MATTAPAPAAPAPVAQSYPVVPYPVAPPMAGAEAGTAATGTPVQTTPSTTTSPQEARFIALMLPLDAADFRAPADAFRRGFEAAAQQRALRMPIQVRATDADPARIDAVYTRAMQEGAAVVVGPMTRNAVSAIATSGLVMVPTLTLNQPDADVRLPAQLHAFGLSAESEARSVAQQAFAQGLRRMAVVGAPGAFARRMGDAFTQAWQGLGGSISVVLEVPPGADMARMRDLLAQRDPDAVFLAAQYQDARMIRPWLPSQMPVWATSQINPLPPDPVGSVDLNGVRFVDMPWLLAPGDFSNPNFSDFPRPTDMQDELLRFYALGVDAERIAAALAAGTPSIDFDGLTGHISVRADGTVERQPQVATFQAGAIAPTLRDGATEAPPEGDPLPQ